MSKLEGLTGLEKIGAGVIGLGGEICKEFGPLGNGANEGVSSLDMISLPGLWIIESWRQHFC